MDEPHIGARPRLGAAPAPGNPNAGPTALRIGTVLLIDDEPIDQKMYSRVIARTGLVDQVVSFRHAEEALTWLETPAHRPVDLILLDIHMPRMTGIEFLEAATARFEDCFATAVLVMLTTALDASDRARVGRCAAFRGHLMKPLTSEMLQDVARQLPGWSRG